MMSDLFKKLNTLLKSTAHDVLGASKRELPNPTPSGRKLEREVVEMRKQVNNAIEFEDQLQAQAQRIQNRIQELDEQSDHAIVRGDDIMARQYIAEMQKQQKQLTFVEADLREHRIVTHELIQRVNTLEAVVSEVKRRNAEVEGAGNQGLAESLSQIQEKLNQSVLQTKERLQRYHQTNEPLDSSQSMSSSELEQEIRSVEVENDLEKRRQRLSKRN